MLVVTVLVMMLSAIPTWYGENAAVQIAAKSTQVPSILVLQQQLENRGIDVKRIDQQENKTVVVLQKRVNRQRQEPYWLK